MVRAPALFALVLVFGVGCGSSGSDTNAATGGSGNGGAATGGTGATSSGGTGAVGGSGGAVGGSGGATGGSGGASGGSGGGAPTTHFAVIGDYGADDSAEDGVAKLVASWSPDFVVTTGDNNYPSGAASTIDATIGQYYHAFIGNYSGSYGAGSPANRFWPSPGNHDWMATDMQPYLDYFTLPGNERYYEVDFGLVHLFSLDSDDHEPDGVTADSTQALWLKDALAASKACFKVVAFHHPPYSSGEHGSSTDLRWPFKAWGADVVLNGHDHTYERSEADGFPYLVVGFSGAGLYQFQNVTPESLVRYDASHGAVLATATSTGLVLEAFSDDGQKQDSYTIAKSCP